MDLLMQLERDEGVRYVPYRDSRGIWTNGVGHKLTAAELGPDGNPLSMDAVSEDTVRGWLSVDVQTACSGLSGYQWFQNLDECRQGVFQNMAYNLGVSGLLHFPSMIHYATIQDWPNTAAQMRSSLWAEQVGARAVRLETQIVTGVWQ